MYSVRQLVARDSGTDLVKIERPLPVLVPTGGGGGGVTVSTTDSSQVSLNDEEETAVDVESRSEDRPFAVTASIFHSSTDGKSGCEDDSPKDIQEEKAFVQALKESLEESIKENDEPAARHSFVKKAPFVFQVRSILSILSPSRFHFFILN